MLILKYDSKMKECIAPDKGIKAATFIFLRINTVIIIGYQYSIKTTLPATF